jgi:hypothetical protein
MGEIMRARFDAIEARITDLERRMYMPQDLVKSLNNVTVP